VDCRLPEITEKRQIDEGTLWIAACRKKPVPHCGTALLITKPFAHVNIFWILFGFPTLMKNTSMGREKTFLPREPPAVHGDRIAVHAPGSLRSEENHMAH